MSKKQVLVKFTLTPNINLPNEFHRQVKQRGGRIHTDKSKVIPRKQKYRKDYE